MSTSTAQAASDTLTAATGQAVMLVQMAPPSWVTYVAALLTPTVAILGFFIAYRQWRTAQEKLALDLFNRRFGIYEAAIGAITKALSRERFTYADLETFNAGTRGTKFLFNDLVDRYLEDLRRKLTSLADVNLHIQFHEDNGGEKNQPHHGPGAIQKLIREERRVVVDDVFKGFMKLPG